MKLAKSVLCVLLALCVFFVAGCNSAATTPPASSAAVTAPPASSAAPEASSSEALAPEAPAAEPEFKLIGAHVATEEHSFHLGMVAFKEEVEAKSGGRITVEIHGNGELGGNEDELVQKMATGTVDVIIAAPSFMAQSVSEVDLLSLPYLFSSIEHWEKVMDGNPGRQMSRLVEEKSGIFNVLGYFKDGVRSMYTVKPVRSVEEMKDMKFRIQNSPTQIAFWSALGTQPTFIAFNEIYQALQNSVIDGAENSIPQIFQQKHFEVAGNITLTEHDVATRFFLMSRQKFDSMPEDLRIIIEEAGANAAAKQREIDLALGEKYIKEMTAANVEIIEIDKQPIIEMTEQIRIDAAEKLGLTDMLNEINSLK